jgi:hypothetical protein
LPGKQKNHKNLSGYPAFRPRSERGTSKYEGVLTALCDIPEELFVNMNLEESDSGLLKGTVQCFVLGDTEEGTRQTSATVAGILAEIQELYLDFFFS